MIMLPDSARIIALKAIFGIYRQVVALDDVRAVYRKLDDNLTYVRLSDGRCIQIETVNFNKYISKIPSNSAAIVPSLF
jgi:hypothetical protein